MTHTFHPQTLRAHCTLALGRRWGRTGNNMVLLQELVIWWEDTQACCDECCEEMQGGQERHTENGGSRSPTF